MIYQCSVWGAVYIYSHHDGSNFSKWQCWYLVGNLIKECDYPHDSRSYQRVEPLSRVARRKLPVAGAVYTVKQLSSFTFLPLVSRGQSCANLYSRPGSALGLVDAPTGVL